MPDIDKRLLIAASIIALVVLGIGFGLGSLAASGDDDAQPDSTSVESGSAPSSETDGSSPTPGATDEPISGDASAAVLPLRTDDSDIPEYGSEEERDEMIAALGEAGVITSNREAILIAADRICYDLERLQAQDRSAAFAVRVVWNESLAELEKEDLAVFSMVFATASFYLCPNSLDYSREVAYWLGF